LQPEPAEERPLEAAFVEHRAFLRALLFRMTGVGADADDLLQDTFARALAHPPRHDRPLRPWLVTVAMNLARDHLRRRRRADYIGPWLPGPDGEAESTTLSPTAVYDRKESASFAFLLALEALSPAQRAVIVLRDVCDYSVKEAAEVLHYSETNVRTTHGRARRALVDYQSKRIIPSEAQSERAMVVLSAFLMAVQAGDLPAIEAQLAESVVELSDAGGVYLAARRPIRGRRNVGRLFLHLLRKSPPPTDLAMIEVAGAPALALRFPRGPDSRISPLVLLAIDLDAEGRIAAIYNLLAPRKLARVALFPGAEVT
jgi:RNA polymerase sigma factor (sigma-70 family)